MGTDNKKREVQRPPVFNTWVVEERSLKDWSTMGERMCCLRKLKKDSVFEKKGMFKSIKSCKWVKQVRT